MGAYLSKGGKSFICMFLVRTRARKAATVKCRIRAHADWRGPWCTATALPARHYVVTEYGKVNAQGPVDLGAGRGR